jgi:hypothetical protein
MIKPIPRAITNKIPKTDLSQPMWVFSTFLICNLPKSLAFREDRNHPMALMVCRNIE